MKISHKRKFKYEFCPPAQRKRLNKRQKGAELTLEPRTRSSGKPSKAAPPRAESSPWSQSRVGVRQENIEVIFKRLNTSWNRGLQLPC